MPARNPPPASNPPIEKAAQENAAGGAGENAAGENAAREDGALDTKHLLGDIGTRTARGGAVMILSQGIKLAAQFGAVAVLARILTPREFGLIAMATTSIMMLEMLRELGLSAATIQRSDITHNQVSALFWINAAVGGALGGLLFASAPLTARFYGEPELMGVIRWLSLGFVISGVTVQHWALLRRQMHFSTIAAVEVSAEIAGFTAAVLMALSGDRYWALVGQRLTATLWTMLGVWLCCRWRPGWGLKARDLKELVHFGLSVTGSTILSTVSRSLDQLLVGRIFGPAVLGVYERAGKVIMSPLNSLNAPIYAVAMPALSRLAPQPDRFRNGVGTVIERIAMVIFPGAVIVAMTADWLTAILFGSGWSEAARFVSGFALLAIIQTMIAMMGLIYLPLGRAHALLRATAIDTALSIVSILAGLPFGAFGVVMALLAGGTFVRLPTAFWLASRCGPVRLEDIYAWIAPSLGAATATAATLAILRGLMPALALGTSPSGLIVIAPSGIFAALAAFAAIPRTRSILGLIRHGGGSRPWSISIARPE